MSAEAGKDKIIMEQEVDLLQYLAALLNAKYRILILAIVVSFSVFGASKLIDNQYTASAILAINISESPGGVKPGNYRSSDLLGLIEHDFVIDAAAENEIERLVARMSSSAFIDQFITENNLLQYIYEDYWDAPSNDWKDGFEPSKLEASSFFRKNMVDIFVDQVTGLLRLNVTTRDPELSADIANKYWKRFNQYAQNIESNELNRRRDYLEEKLATLTNLEMQRSIFRLIETQLATEALLYGREGYPLELIQEALPPLVKSYPGRKIWTLFAFVIVVLLAIIFVISKVIFENIAAALKSHPQLKTQINTDNKRKKKIDEVSIKDIIKENNKINTTQEDDGQDRLSDWVD